VESLKLLASVFDTVLAASLLFLAWRVLMHQDLFRTVVLFIAFGLLMALAWVRLDAPDIALAEAAIGAGLSGALLLVALARLQSVTVKADDQNNLMPTLSVPLIGYLISLTAILGLLLYTVSLLPTEGTGLNQALADNLNASGVSHPVTAVLLNFRAYDTFLELAVLLVAFFGASSLTDIRHYPDDRIEPVLATLSQVLFPIMILVAMYLLWVGATRPGGAFQAGSVLAAAMVLLFLSGGRLRLDLQGQLVRLLLIGGVMAFLVVSLITMLIGNNFLQFPISYAAGFIFVLEFIGMISIAAVLSALFLGCRGNPGRNQ
jgi:multisubunit Na+/H+ antiporter MnhB subunit